MQRVFMKSTSF